MLKGMCVLSQDIFHEDIGIFDGILNRLKNVKSVEECISELTIASPEKKAAPPPSSKKRMNFSEFKRQREEMFSRSSTKDPTKQIRVEIIRCLNKFFLKHLRQMKDDYFIVKCPNDIDRVKLRITEAIEHGLDQSKYLSVRFKEALIFCFRGIQANNLTYASRIVVY